MRSHPRGSAPGTVLVPFWSPYPQDTVLGGPLVHSRPPARASRGPEGDHGKRPRT
jgi:hypothetical protein